MSTQSSAARLGAPSRTSVPRGPQLTPMPGGASSPRLQGIRAPLQAGSRVPFLVLCMTILCSALLCALVLNIVMTNGSYEGYQLRRDVGRTAQDAQELQSRLQAAETNLPALARDFGMVESGPPILLDLTSGTVLVGVQGADQ